MTDIEIKKPTGGLVVTLEEAHVLAKGTGILAGMAQQALEDAGVGRSVAQGGADWQFLFWCADRLVNFAGDPPDADYIQRLRKIADRLKQQEAER